MRHAKGWLPARRLSGARLRHSVPLLVLVAFLFGCGEESPPTLRLGDHAVILAFGDSLTYGTGAAKGEDYPSRLASLTGHTVINAGVPGETTDEGLARLPRILEQHRPDVVILWHGGNDVLRNLDPQMTEVNLRRMLQLARGTGAEVILVGVPTRSVFLDPAPVYEKLAASENVSLVGNPLKAILRNPGLKADSIHPNGAGYARIANDISQLIQ
jgi:acyl-CoA thioesterase-1